MTAVTSPVTPSNYFLASAHLAMMALATSTEAAVKITMAPWELISSGLASLMMETGVPALKTYSTGSLANSSAMMLLTSASLIPYGIEWSMT